MSNQSVVIDIGLNTQSADSSLKELEDRVPKQLQRLVKKFEQMERKATRFSGAIDKTIEKQKNSAGQKVNYVKEIDDQFDAMERGFNRRIRKLQKESDYQKATKAGQQKMRQYLLATRANAEMEGLIGDILGSKKFNSKDVTKIIKDRVAILTLFFLPR